MNNKILLNINAFNLYVNGNPLIKDFNLTIREGEVVGIFSPSGSGKSSLIKKLCDCLIEEKDYNTSCQIDFPFGKNISVCFQNPALMPSQTVYKNLYLGLKNKMDKKTADEIIRTVLSEVNLSDKIKEKAKKLSGGQQQRLSLARALSYPCQLLLLDEPFVFQDEDNYSRLIDYTKKIIEEKKLSGIIISHNKADLEKLCSRIVSFV